MPEQDTWYQVRRKNIVAGDYNLKIACEGYQLIYIYDPAKKDNGVVSMLDQLKQEGIKCSDFNTQQSSLEEIFVSLVGEK